MSSVRTHKKDGEKKRMAAYVFLSKQTIFLIGLGFVIRICEDGMTRHDMVLQQRLEILLTRGAEQECIHFSRQFGECLVCRREECTTDLRAFRIENVDETGLDEC